MLSIIKPMHRAALSGKMLLIIIAFIVFNLFIGTKASCEILLSPEHGTLNVLEDGKVNSLALYSCDNGWKLVGVSVSKCNKTGQWTPPPPKCIAEKRSSSLTTATAILPTATTAVTALPEPKATSVENEEQDHPKQTTDENNCSCTYNSRNRKLFADVNGSGLWNGDKVSKGDKMTLRCYDHAKQLVLPNATSISGTLELTCDVCQVWEDSNLPSCEDIRSEKNCDVPQKPEHGTVEFIGSATSPMAGTIAVFTCEGDRIASGPTSSKCLSTGEWTFPTPSCLEINCAPPANPEHGGVRYSSLEYGTELRYECDKGFVISQHEERTCTADGTWSNTEPVCIEGSCEMPLAPKNGNVQMAGTPKVGTVALYSCKEGKTMVGPSASKCLITGEWTFPPPKCLSPCVLSAIRNGGVGYVEMETRRVSRYNTEKWFVEFQVGKIFKDEETAIFRCRDGFEPVESTQPAEGWRGSGEVVTCKDGQWSKLLECKPESCYGEPPPVDNGYPVVNNRSHGYGIYYLCDDYYVKTAEDDVKCSYGKWTGETPKCIDSRCYASQLNHPDLEKLPVNFIEHGQNYAATCIKGFKVSRKGIKVSCNSGKWTIPAAICVEESCDGEPPSVDNGYPVVINRSHGSGIYYLCNRYYVKSAAGKVKCSYGQWDGYTPTCIDGRCYVSQLNHPGLEELPVDFVEHGKDYPATCMKGFEALNQSIKVSCEDGKWNVSAANCVKVDEVVTTPASPKAEVHGSRQSENCFCTFNPRSQHLVAVVNGQRLENGDPVRKGNSALLSCTDLRLHLFWSNGMRTLDANMTCEVCEAWGSNELPSCEDTHPGDSFIVLNKNVEVQPGGAVESRLGRNLTIECISWNTIYPDWYAPMKLPVSRKVTRVDEQYTSYQSFIHVENFGQQHAGSYECSARTPRPPHRSLRPTKLDLITDCYREPHGILHGRYYIQSRSHKSRVEYECDDSYEMTNPSTVQCLHGKWTGQPAQCVKAIPAASVSSVGQEGIYKGTSNNSTPKPIPSKEPSLGGEDDCFCTYNNADRLVIAMYYNRRLWHGDKVRKYTWTQLTCADQAMHLVLPNGTEISTGKAKLNCSVCETWEIDQLPTCETTYYPGLTCPQIVIFDDIEVKYSEGRRVGSTATFCCSDSSFTLVGRNFKCLENGMWDSNQKPYCQRTLVSNKNRPNPPASKESKSEEDCVCTYRENWKLKAVFNGERIWRGTNITKGESIQLRCVEEGKRLVLPNGTMIMSESVTWTCYRCGAGGASDMPTCEEIQLPEPEVLCPPIRETDAFSVQFTKGRKINSIVHFRCKDANLKIAGGLDTRTCMPVGQWSGTNPDCEVVTCPQFEKTEGLTVKYTNKRRVHSTATFSCAASFVLYGSRTLHCQQTGKWNQLQPICRKQEVLCPPIRETDVFSVQFTNGRKINSTAHFRCKDANMRIAGGLDTRTCLPAGQWSGDNPDCEAPGCLIEDFTDTAPRNLLPRMVGETENLQPIASELSMHCEKGWVLTGEKKAKCGPLGKWNFGNAQCIIGCQLNITDESAAPIINPHKDIYRFGESVIVSCFEGYELTSNVERVLCMEMGWSDPIPNCKEKINK